MAIGVAVEVLWGERNEGKGGREKKKNGVVRVGVVSLEVGDVVEWLYCWKEAQRRNDGGRRVEKVFKLMNGIFSFILSFIHVQSIYRG